MPVGREQRLTERSLAKTRIIIAAMMRSERKERPSGSTLHPYHAGPGHRRGHGEI